jgi:putative ABC transport system ATP-binding protein
MSARLEVSGITVVRDGRRIVDAASLALAAGGVATVQGPSGSGKSTLLRAIATLVPVARGRITFEGHAVSDVIAYRRSVAYVPQLPRMFDGSVADNVRTGPRFRGVTLEDADVVRLVEQVGLSRELAERDASKLAGGERLRVALARALANEPRVLLLDEPTSALDPESARVVLDLVRDLAHAGTSVLAVTHVEADAERLGGARYRMTTGALEAA